MNTKLRFLCSAAAFLFCLCSFSFIHSLRTQASAEDAAHAQKLPVCADVAGVYLQLERAEPGARLLSSYMNSFTTITARPYTQSSRNKLYIFQTIVSTPYAGNASFNPYFEEVTQIAPYIFTDRRGVTYEFDVNAAGDVTQLRVDGVCWAPSSGLNSRFAINATILLLQLLSLYLVVAIACTAYYFHHHRRRHWISLIATKLNTALTVALAASLVTNAFLLIRAVPTIAYADLRIFFILNIAFLIALPVLSVAVLLTAGRSELDRRQRICYSINITWSMLMFTILLAWGLYR